MEIKYGIVITIGILIFLTCITFGIVHYNNIQSIQQDLNVLKQDKYDVGYIIELMNYEKKTTQDDLNYLAKYISANSQALALFDKISKTCEIKNVTVEDKNYISIKDCLIPQDALK